MSDHLKRISGWWMAAVLSGATLGAAGGDLRLVEAVRRGDRQLIRSLLEQRVDVNAPEGDGATALVWATHRDDLETAKLLISARADVNAANDSGVTPLSLACTNRNAALVEALLQAGANPAAALWSGETPLMTCARTGTIDAVKSLLLRKADPNAQTRRGQTALMWAVAHNRLEIARALIDHGADVNAASRMLAGFTPARYLTFGLKDSSFDEPSDEVHQDPLSSRGGFTPLMFAAKADDVASARLLLAAGAQVNHSAPPYGNALVVAAVNGAEKLGTFLLENGADPNVSDVWGLTALHYALPQGLAAIGMARARIPSDAIWIRSNMPELLQALLAHGANPNARIVDGLPPFNYLPFARDDINQLPYLRQPGATPFLLAAAAADVGSMRALLAAGANPLLGTEDGATPLIVAAGLGKLQALTKEEEEKALEAVRLVAELGADVNAATRDGRTALMGAAHIGANTIIQFLADNGANLDASDRYGQTALGLALNARAPQAPRARGNRRNFRSFSAGQGLSGQGPGTQKSTSELLLKLGATPLSAEPRRGSTGPVPMR